MDPLQNGLSRAECILSYISRIPGIGTLSGAIKVGMGTIQMLAATSGVLVGVPARIFFGNKRIIAYSLDQLKNGAGNIAAGSLEAIPIAGTFLWMARKDRCLRKAEALYYKIQGKPDTASKKEKDTLQGLNEEAERKQIFPRDEAVRRADLKTHSLRGIIQFPRLLQFQHYHIFHKKNRTDGR